jgi:hypothetical protein
MREPRQKAAIARKAKMGHAIRVTLSPGLEKMHVGAPRT